MIWCTESPRSSAAFSSNGRKRDGVGDGEDTQWCASVIGTLTVLLLVYINNNEPECSHFMFGEDLMLVGDPNITATQRHLDRMYTYSTQWKLPPDADKLKMLTDDAYRAGPGVLKVDDSAVDTDRGTVVKGI